jgi:hypothetical protein
MLGEARGGNVGLAREVAAVFGYNLTSMKQSKKLSSVGSLFTFA